MPHVGERRERNPAPGHGGFGAQEEAQFTLSTATRVANLEDAGNGAECVFECTRCAAELGFVGTLQCRPWPMSSAPGRTRTSNAPVVSALSA